MVYLEQKEEPVSLLLCGFQTLLVCYYVQLYSFTEQKKRKQGKQTQTTGSPAVQSDHFKKISLLVRSVCVFTCTFHHCSFECSPQ